METNQRFEYKVVRLDDYQYDKMSGTIAEDAFQPVAKDGWQIIETIEANGDTGHLILEREVQSE